MVRSAYENERCVQTYMHSRDTLARDGSGFMIVIIFIISEISRRPAGPKAFIITLTLSIIIIFFLYRDFWT